jgi:hypothetical protein
VFVLGDPADRNVLWPSQTIMATRLAQAGVPSKPRGQGLGRDQRRRRVAGWCWAAADRPVHGTEAALGLSD